MGPRFPLGLTYTVLSLLPLPSSDAWDRGSRASRQRAQTAVASRSPGVSRESLAVL